MFKDILEGRFTQVPSLEVSFIDVIDCARAHVNALTNYNPKAKDARFIIQDKSMRFKELFALLKSQYGPQG